MLWKNPVIINVAKVTKVVAFLLSQRERRTLMYAKLDKLREDLKKAVAKREAADAKVKQLEAKLKEEENQQMRWKCQGILSSGR